MDFCDGESLLFERLMRRAPGVITEPDDGKSCADCAYYTDRSHMCALDVCPYDMTESEVR